MKLKKLLLTMFVTLCSVAGMQAAELASGSGWKTTLFGSSNRTEQSATKLVFLVNETSLTGGTLVGTNVYALYDADTKVITFYTSDSEIMLPASAYNMFANLRKCTQFVGLDHLNTSNVTNMSSMFSMCSVVTSLDLSSFNTANVTTLESMFKGNAKLTDINWGTNFKLASGCWWAMSMFEGCTALTSMDLSGLVVGSKGTLNVEAMFRGCTNLQSVTLFPITGCKSAASLFENCSSLVSVNVSAIGGTGNVTDFSNIFKNCTSLTSLDLSSWWVKNQSCDGMFAGCTSLTDIKAPHFNQNSGVTSIAFPVPNGTNGKYWFRYKNDPTSPTLDNMYECITKNSATDNSSYNYVLKSFSASKVLTVTMSSVGLNTYAPSGNFIVPRSEDFRMYYVSAYDAEDISFQAIPAGVVIPAGTGLLLEGEPGSVHSFINTDRVASFSATNYLVGTTEAVTFNTDHDAYLLAKQNGVVGFYKNGAVRTLAAGKSYLPALQGVAAPSRMIFIAAEVDEVEAEDETSIATDIESVSDTKASVKGIYTIMGQKISSISAPGLYIVDGKKVLVNQ